MGVENLICIAGQIFRKSGTAACLCFLFLLNNFFGWEWVLLLGLGVLQFGGIEVLDAVDHVNLLFLLLDGWK